MQNIRRTIFKTKQLPMNQNRCFPNNTVAWLRQKSQEDPNYLPRLLSSENYNNFVRRYEMQGQFDQIESNEEKNAEIAENIWKDMVMLMNRSTDNQTKQFATNFIEHLRKSWREEKEEFIRNNPNS
jgi:hypothetical protein